MLLLEVVVIVLILSADYQFDLSELMHQQLPLIEVVDKNFDSLVTHTSVGLLCEDQVEEELVQLILVVELLVTAETIFFIDTH